MVEIRPIAHFVLIVLSSQILKAEGANILFFIGFGGPSHRLAMQPLADALAEKGHSVTFLIQDIPKKDNSTIQYYSPKLLTEFFVEMRGNISFYGMRASGVSALQSVFIQWFGITVCDKLYSDPTFLEWMGKNKFDLVIMDGLFNECGYGIAHVHNAKTIVFSISTVLPWVVDGIGIPDESSYIPEVMLGFNSGMNFLQRTLTALMPVAFRIFRHAYYFPQLTKITRDGLGKSAEEFPSFAELERNTSLVFLNTHPAQEYPRSLPPNTIPVGGMSWAKKKKPLPKRLEDFIAKLKEGFVYVSFGSFIDFLTFPTEVQEQFVNGLRRFPNIQFIWKLNETPKNLPEHIMVEKWLPQQDLLLHPKIRGFVSHAGIGGVNEAIYSAVPLILFPIFTEQDYNAYLAENKGFGIKMEITTLTGDKLEAAINKLLANKSYKENMEKVRSQFLDRPMKPVDSAVWWTEYVLRQDTSFLRPLNVHQSWWVKRQIDVWLFVLFSLISFNVIALYVVYKIFQKCCCPAKKKDTTKKLKKN